MRVFGYGSLMWDGWEQSWGCKSKTKATLKGLRRSFNKLSVKNWGTKNRPGLTLNLEPDDAGSCCEGVLFEFPLEKSDEVMSYLKGREGKGFEYREATVETEDGTSTTAFVPFYVGKNIIAEKDIDKLAEIVRIAEGESGTCIDYVRGIAQKLEEMGIEDLAVKDLKERLDGMTAYSDTTEEVFSKILSILETELPSEAVQVIRGAIETGTFDDVDEVLDKVEKSVKKADGHANS